jgi:hypothetical protein
MLRLGARILIAIGLLFAPLGSAVLAQQQRVVTVKELFASNHRLEVEVGTIVVWADPHFGRVWFPRGGPDVKPTDAGPATRFDTRGTYRGTFTLTAGHGVGDVYSVTVVVKERSR